MVFLKQCFCYSLRQGSFIIGTYSLIVYCVAFAVELWWIAEALLTLPVPTYALCALYFFNFIMAAVLLFGLLVRQRKYLMSWTLMTALSFFPEAGMVLFMSLYYWPTAKYEYGVIELVYWALRAIFNIFGALCVCSLYLSWRDEELIVERLHNLNLANLDGPPGVGNFRSTLKRHRQSRRLSHRNNSSSLYSNKNVTLGYHNFAYNLDSPPTSEDTSYSTTAPHQQRSRTSQSFTSHANYHHSPSQQSQQRRLGSRPSNTTLGNSGTNIPGRKAGLNPHLIFDPTLRKSRISEWGIAGIGIEPECYPGTTLQRSKSLWNVSNDDYWARAPPTRPVSMGYVNHTLTSRDIAAHDANSTFNLNNKSRYMSELERRKKWMLGMTGRRAASMDGLNFYRYYNQNILANQKVEPSWSRSSLESEEEGYLYERDRGSGAGR